MRMDAREVLIDGIGRSREVCHQVLDGLSAADANWRPSPAANSITWLIWHIAREQDVQIAPLHGTDEVWLRDGWVEQFGLALSPKSMGYGHTPDDVGKVVVTDTGLLTGYLDAATAATIDYVTGIDITTLDEVIDKNWEPPVTRGVRLVSIVDDAAQHAGQAAFLRGLLPR